MKQFARLTFYTVGLLLIGAFLWISNQIAEELAEEEQKKVEVWAEAIRLFTSENDLDGNSLSLVGRVLEDNTTIPVILCDSNDSILLHNNLDIKRGSSDRFMEQQLRKMKEGKPPLIVNIDDKTTQRLYYSDSTLQWKLAYFPYFQLIIMIAFIGIAYYAIKQARKAEQDSVWVGLSKETAHQLGTPISSLMAWIELLRVKDIDPDMLSEMDKDTSRLKTIAERFSKIGSKPQMEEKDFSLIALSAIDYMKRRISSKVQVTSIVPSEPMLCNLSTPLIEWVIENITKNAIDAIDGAGTLEFTIKRIGKQVVLNITDSGKGIPSKQLKNIFAPGYTTKSRGWGLGLTLSKRIIEEYHAGRIYVLHSEIGKGTTFRIELPLTED